MYVQVGAHTMARAVHVAQSLAPHGPLGEHVELRAADARGELGQLYLDVAFQHQRVDAAHLVGQRSQGDGAGDVGCAVHILCAAVEQQQSLRAQGHVGLLSGLIVHNGPVLSIGRNGIERDVAIERLLSAQGRQFLVDRQF